MRVEVLNGYQFIWAFTCPACGRAYATPLNLCYHGDDEWVGQRFVKLVTCVLTSAPGKHPIQEVPHVP